MKSMILATLVAAGLATAAAAPAWAQSDTDATATTGWYGSLGYTLERKDRADMNLVHGVVGDRLLPYFGLEGEAYAGIGKKDAPGLGGDLQERLAHGVAGYAVGYLPLGPHLDLLARVGYGTSRYTVFENSDVLSRASRESVNYGVGAQYFLNSTNGLRIDYTRKDFTKSPLSANDWGVSYIHRF